MKAALVAAAVAALLSSQVPTLPRNGSGPLPEANAEHIESGEVLPPGGVRIDYRIRLLPVASFPDLPAEVAAELTRRQCMIPQSFEAKQPENVIQGAFRAPGSHDWAVLCSSRQATTLYVFFAGSFQSPIALRSQPDSAWLAADPGSDVLGSAWGIAVRSKEELRASPELRRGVVFDHDAIDDARLERSVAVRYFYNGQWTRLDRGDDGN